MRQDEIGPCHNSVPNPKIDFSLLFLYQDPLENLNEWSSNTNKLMDLVMKTTHLINKEEMVIYLL